MAGGTYEFVSGELSTSSSQSTSSNAEYILNPVRPPYVDLYVIKANGFDSKAAWSYDDEGQYYNIDRCTWEECGGHDLHETKRLQTVSYRNISWDENQSYFAFANYPWFLRGGIADDGARVGIYNSYPTNGGRGGDNGFRTALLVLP